MSMLCHCHGAAHTAKPFVQHSTGCPAPSGRVHQLTVARAAASSQDQGAVKCVKGAMLGAAVAAGLALSSFEPAEAAGIWMKGFPGGSGGEEGELSEKYMQGTDKKRLQAAKRKEALSKRRAEALKSGGAAEAPAASGDKETDPEVIAANEEVDRSNREREKDSERMMAAIRSKSQQYTKQAYKKPGLLQ